MVISWGTYLTAWFVTSALYYVIVILLFFRKGINMLAIRNRLKQGSVGDRKRQTADEILFRAGTDKQDQQLDAAAAAPMHSLVDELQAYISQAGKQEASKEEVSASLKKLLQKYPAIKGSLFQEGITNLIAVISENNCGIHFSADELSGLWNY